METFGLDRSVVCAFLAAVEAGYHFENAFHNNIHAADVTQVRAGGSGCAVRRAGWGRTHPGPPAAHRVPTCSSCTAPWAASPPTWTTWFPSSLRRCTTLIIRAPPYPTHSPPPPRPRASTHPARRRPPSGRTNNFLVARRHELAVRYSDRSVLEMHHLASAFRVMYTPGTDILAPLSKKLCVPQSRPAVACTCSGRLTRCADWLPAATRLVRQSSAWFSRPT